MKIAGVIFLLVLVAGVAATEYELSWDDGAPTGTVEADGYWAVQFDHPYGPGYVCRLGICTLPAWPDGQPVGEFCVYDEVDGHPGSPIFSEPFLPLCIGVWEWLDVNVDVSTGHFYVVWHDELGQSYLARDAAGTGRTWKNQGGSWVSTSEFDVMLRCYWSDEETAVQEGSWGQIKTLW